MKNRFTPRLLAAAAALWLPAAGGCGDLIKQPYPAKSYFAIDPAPPDGATAPSPAAARSANAGPANASSVDAGARVVAATRPMADRVMLVHPVRVAAPYDGLTFVYWDLRAGYDLDYYANWVAPPSALLGTGLSAWLDRAGPLPVVTPGSAVRQDVVLDVEVTRLLIDRTDRARPRAVLAARFFLTREAGAGTSVLSDTSYTAEARAAPDTPAGYAAAWGLAWRHLLQRASDDLRTTLAGAGSDGR